jgi:hypothetical protein
VTPQPTYRFGPLERRGLLGSVRAGQAAIVALGAVAAITLLDALPSAQGALLAATVLVAAVGSAAVPIDGRTPEEWLPVIACFLVRGWRGHRSFRALAPQRGMRSGNLRAEWVEGAAEPPPELRDVRIDGASYRGRRIGILVTDGGRRLIAVLACRAAGFALLDPAARNRRLARWGQLLSSSATTAIVRLQWLERTAPAQGDELARWVHAQRDPAIPPRGAAIVESYLELIGTTTRVTNEHEVLLALQLDARRVRARGPEASAAALFEQAERVARGLEAAEVTVLGALGEDQLARTLRTAFDPFCRAELAALEAADHTRRGLPAASAWPLAAEETWEHYRTDGAVHATYWIAGWPRVEVPAMFMDSLLGHSGTVRTVAVVLEPIPPERSTREAEAAVTRDRANRELRLRFGQSQTARQRQAEEAAARREAELAAGHGEVRLAGFVTVSGRDPEELRLACAEVIDHAARARLELRRMYGQQATAFTFTLPLCRGLR